MISADSYIYRTGQSWKIWVSIAFLSASGVLYAIGFFSPLRNQPDTFAPVVLAGTALGFVGFIWLTLSIRCKACSTRLGWKAVSSGSAGTWFINLLKADRCPICESTGLDKKAN